MKMQFAFGNPRRGKRKKVAKRRKKLKTKSVKKKSYKVGKMAKAKRRKKVRKNPAVAVVKKGGKVVHRGFSPLSKREEDVLKGKIAAAKAKYMKAPSASNEKAAAFRELNGLVKQASSKLKNRGAYLKTLSRYAEEGASIKEYDFKKGAKVAKKKRKKKKSKKVSAKKVRRSKKRRGSKRKKMSKAAKKAFVARMKKARKGGKKRRKSSKRRRSKKVAHSAAPKKARRSKRRKSSKRRRRARMITHKHASSTRHFKKGSSFRFKSKAKRGKRSISITGRVKVNPYRRNPMANVSAQMKKALGLSTSELGSLALGGALVPIINAGIGKIPGAGKVVTAINNVVGSQATGSVIPILIGAGLNLLASKAGKHSDKVQMAGEGLVAAGVIGLTIGLSQKYLAPALGMSGINYTPTMRGINYTPSMGIMPQLNGINYTPNRGMGIMPQLNGVDFGAANYGGGGGSKEARTQRSDFGADWSEDSEADHFQDEDDSLSSSMN